MEAEGKSQDSQAISEEWEGAVVEHVLTINVDTFAKQQIMHPSELSEEWKQDSKLDQVLLDQSSLAVPCLHAKYVDILSEFKRELRHLEKQKKSIPITERRTTTNYQDILDQIDEYKDGIDAVEKIIHAINNISFLINSAVKWRIFMGGGLNT